MDEIAVIPEWAWEPSILIGTGLITAFYVWMVLPRFSGKPIDKNKLIWFLSGILVIFLALVSPLDGLGDEYLFSAHMLQHTLIAVIAPPLILLGLPGWLVEKFTRPSWIRQILKILTNPVIALILFNLVFAGWHVRQIYEATLQNEALHILQHILFIGLGIINWWPVLSPTKTIPALSYPGQSLYLFIEAIPCTVLGAIIIFAPEILYPYYAEAPRIFNLSPMDDQQIAGLIMAVPAGFIYLGAFAFLFSKWIGSEKNNAQPTQP